MNLQIRILRLSFGILFLIIGNLSVMSQEVRPLFECTQKLDRPYGFCTHITRKAPRYDFTTMRRQMELMRSIGASFCRSDIDYGTIADHDSALLDTILNETRRNGFGFLGIAYDSEFQKKSWQDNSAFAPYLRTLCDRYAGRMRYVEFCNEVNLVGQENVAGHYVDDLNRFYSIKKKNRKLRILFSGILADHRFEFLDSAMCRGAYRYIDIMNFHTYRVPEDMIPLMQRIRDNMNRYGWSKPVWITECGMHTALTGSHSHETTAAREDEQARRVARIHLIAFAYGVDKVFWYKFRACENDPTYSEDFFGLVHHDLSPKPAFHAYRVLTSMCPSGSTRPILTRHGQTYDVHWKRTERCHVHALWEPAGKSRLELENADWVKFYDYMGQSININGQTSIALGSCVVYAVSKKIWTPKFR